MIFIVDYDRRRGELNSLVEFRDEEREAASAYRLDLELSLPRDNANREVVSLQGASPELLKTTHARYFCSLEELAERLRVALEAHCDALIAHFDSIPG